MSAAPPADPNPNRHEHESQALAQEVVINPFLPQDLPPVHEAVETGDAAAAAAVVAVAAAVEVSAVANGEMGALPVAAEDLKSIRDQQQEQAQLIANMQSTIDGLSAKQAELEDEIRNLKGGQFVVKLEPKRQRRGEKDRVSQAQALLSVGANGSGIEGNTEDDEIEAIVESRRLKKAWPLKRKYCSYFTKEVDLVKIRFHRSEKHRHKSVRIPKVDKSEGYGLGNREGRLICRLCSGKTINRNTSWMCVDCCVPLCVDVVNGDPESSCHARWHSCQDLVAVNATLNAALRERRESKKRSRDSTSAAERGVAEAIREAAGLDRGGGAEADAGGVFRGGEVVPPLMDARASAVAGFSQVVEVRPPPPLQVVEPKAEVVEMVEPKVELKEMVQEQQQAQVEVDPNAEEVVV